MLLSWLNEAGNNVLLLQLSVEEIKKYEMKSERRKTGVVKSQETGLGAAPGTFVTKYILNKAKKWIALQHGMIFIVVWFVEQLENNTLFLQIAIMLVFQKSLPGYLLWYWFFQHH